MESRLSFGSKLAGSTVQGKDRPCDLLGHPTSFFVNTIVNPKKLSQLESTASQKRCDSGSSSSLMGT